MRYIRRTRGSGGAESVVGGTLKQHVFASGARLFVLYIPTALSVYCDNSYLGQSLWPLGTYVLTALYARCVQLTLGYTISGSFYAGLSPTYFLCASCTPGSFSLGGSQQCTSCPVGTEQPASASAACTDCAAGYVSVSPGTVSCSACAGGTYETARMACYPCGPGTYSAVSSTGCLDCPENTFSSGSRDSCSPCPYNSISQGGGDLSGCLCEAGYLRQLAPFFVCYPCQAGGYSSFNATACIPCDVGTYSAASATACTQCGTGTYQPNTGGDRCLACQAGTLSDPGSRMCQACPAPLYCEGSGRYAYCPLGTYSISTGLQSVADCPVCPANSFCQTSGDIESCPPHTSSVTGSVSKLGCRCNPGYTCTYNRAVRVNITLPLTQAQFELVRGQFLQAVADAAGVSVSQVSITGMSLLAPPQNATRRRILASESFTGLHIEAHVEGVEQIAPRRLRQHLLSHGIHARHTRTRQAHTVHARQEHGILTWLRLWRK